MIIYLGNKLGRRKGNPTGVDYLGSRLQEFANIKTSSDANNQLLRLFEMIFTVVKNSSKSKLVLIDTYSSLGFWYAIICSVVCRVFSIPYLPILRGGNLPERLKSNGYLTKVYFKKAYKLVAPSSYLFDVFIKSGYKNIQMIPNHIDLKNYPFKQRTNFKPNLLWVRSFHKVYNPKMAIEVLKLLHEKGIEAKLTMVGPDKDGSINEIQQLISENNLTSHVKITGRLNKNEWITLSEDHDIFINTTNIDNTPLSVIEAMSLGLVIISTNPGGVPYLLANNEDSLLVAPNDIKGMAKNIIQVINAPHEGINMSNKAREKVEKFDWQVTKKSWKELVSLE